MFPTCFIKNLIKCNLTYPYDIKPRNSAKGNKIGIDLKCSVYMSSLFNLSI